MRATFPITVSSCCAIKDAEEKGIKTHADAARNDRLLMICFMY
jgi:hypothetical protein